MLPPVAQKMLTRISLDKRRCPDIGQASTNIIPEARDGRVFAASDR